MALHEIDSEISAWSCCVASDVSDYVSKVLRLGKDVNYRDKVSNAILARNERIFDDKQVSFEWARFLTRAVGMVLDEKTLAIDMAYTPNAWQKNEFVEHETCREQRRWKRSKIVESFLS